MIRELQPQQGEAEPVNRRGLVVGNYCHDVLIRDGLVVGESLGGAASFVSNVLDGLAISCDYVSKVGSDFAYSVSHPPICSSSLTTLFHAYFSSDRDGKGHQDRVLRRIHACDPILPSDLPEFHFDFGLAVGVAGEILPETLERMLDICNVVFVDIQALIRVFDPIDGTVKHVALKESGFSHLLSRISFLKASAEEAPFLDVEESRKCCSLIVTDGKDGCRVYWEYEEKQILPFPTCQIDPTGAGDSFLGAFVAGLIKGLPVLDAVLLGNFFGSLTVGQIGLPTFDFTLLQRVNDQLPKRKMQCTGCCKGRDAGSEEKSLEHELLRKFLADTAKLASSYHGLEVQRDPPDATRVEELRVHHENNGQLSPLTNPVYEEVIQPVEGRP